MTLVLTLTASLLMAGAGECYFVSNTRIVVLSSCDFSPEATAALEAQEPAPTRPRSWQPQQRASPGLRRTRATSRDAPRFADEHRQQELKRKLDTAERQRAATLAQRDAALRELAVVRRELAAARVHIEQDRRAELHPQR